MSILDPKIDRSFLNGLYRGEYLPESVDVKDFVISSEVSEEQKPEPSSGPVEGMPLTPSQAEQASRDIKETKAKVQAVRDKIKAVRGKIDSEIATGLAARNKNEFSFQLDISRKPILKRAIRQVFGIDTNVITYSMYKDLLELRKQLELEDVQGYIRGYDGSTEKGLLPRRRRRS